MLLIHDCLAVRTSFTFEGDDKFAVTAGAFRQREIPGDRTVILSLGVDPECVLYGIILFLSHNASSLELILFYTVIDSSVRTRCLCKMRPVPMVLSHRGDHFFLLSKRNENPSQIILLKSTSRTGLAASAHSKFRDFQNLH